MNSITPGSHVCHTTDCPSGRSILQDLAPKLQPEHHTTDTLNHVSKPLLLWPPQNQTYTSMDARRLLPLHVFFLMCSLPNQNLSRCISLTTSKLHSCTQLSGSLRMRFLWLLSWECRKCPTDEKSSENTMPVQMTNAYFQKSTDNEEN